MGLGFNTFIVGTLVCSCNFNANMVTIVTQKIIQKLSIHCAILFQKREREIILEQRILKQPRNKMDDTIAVPIISCRRVQERWHCLWACFHKTPKNESSPLSFTILSTSLTKALVEIKN
jgi:hypothetical protein